MGVRKTEQRKISSKHVFASSEEFQHCLHILSAIRKEFITTYTLEACKKQINNLSISDFRIKRPMGKYPIKVHIDEQLKDELEKFGTIRHSHILQKCLVMEVQEQIARWGCQTPGEFIELMSNENPLKKLNAA